MIIEKYIQKDEEISLKIVQTKIDSLKRKNIIRTGCRAYDGKYIGIAGALGGHDEKFLENEARAALSLKVPYEYEPGCDLNLSKNLSCDIFAENELISEVETLLEAVRIAQPDFSFSDAVKLINYEERILNDRGLDLCYRDRILVLSLLFKKKTSVNILDGFVSFKGRKYDRAAFLKHLNAVCGAYNNLIDLPAGERFPVIFSTEDPTPLIKFAQDLHGLRFGTKSSIFSDKSGQKLFSDKFDFYFCLDPAENPGSFFDAEGSVNEGFETPLIKNGVLISPYTDKNTSKTYGLPYTKSASCEYDGIPQPALTAHRIASSQKTAKELLGGRPAIFVMIASGGDFTPEGNFATPVQLALYFDGENFIGKLPELQISSNVYEMFGGAYIGVSKDSYFPLSREKCLIMDLKVSKM
ncbi:MAG: hypothetical protein A2008_07140 [Candidatus Wallbacteria bacterium GWC2_49_35]|uniref:Metalloprotease TldD/E C-terminal domain-containing protein n=1 Tax=Candidatus Wallbacteria bacterium GWC2_49_35 TaxID=1817813 RepID=A0A1F7X080_9BACT|nr:MAG: hypothetical protein A2008_07140 [Candidatus Wallbacteria bacterium GWC2_49_35]HBC75522.1 peptidase U62 [Candidatus Wallbacteria bacterium]